MRRCVESNSGLESVQCDAVCRDMDSSRQITIASKACRLCKHAESTGDGGDKAGAAGQSMQGRKRKWLSFRKE